MAGIDNTLALVSLMLFMFSFFLLLVLIRLRTVLGPFFIQSIKVAFGRMKDPNLFIHFLNSKSAIIEWRSYNQVVKLDPEEPTSELVYVNRDNGYTPVTPRKSSGFFNFFRKKDDSYLNTVYTDDFVPVRIDNNKAFWTFGRQLHIVYEGQNMTQNPLANFSQDPQVKKAGIAVEHQLSANKLLAFSESINKLATRDDVRNMGLLNLILLGIGIVALIVLLMGLSGTLGDFTKFVTSTFETYKPVLEQYIKDNIPRVVVDGQQV